MTRWHASYDLRLTAAGLAAATVAKMLYTREALEVGGLRSGLDTSG
jgi:hypothetical protein